MADQVDRADLIKQFSGIVSCNEQQAQFFLEANAWDLNSALSNYIEEPNASSGSMDTEESLLETQSSTSVDSKNKSGVFMQNPNAKPTKPSNSLVSDILKKAAEGGRGPVEEPEATTSAQRSFFTGAGYRLGNEEEPSVVINPTANSTTSTEPLTPVVRHLTFWRNGFSIEEGSLMSYDDPANEEFLKAINSGRAPLSWLNVRQDQPVDVRVARRLDEDYKPPPKKPAKPFSGTGQRLGSLTPNVITINTPGTFPSTSSSEPTPRARELEIDESLPITSIQIRLGDGTRMRTRFNHTHTVGDIRNFINASRVGEEHRDYILQTTFPPKDLKNEQTLIDASLLNSVVIQRYI
ncbi:20019_t:CDS:10 [Funneliformis geosporum]|uniref:412_t:CDS:1 n=1 Tax=Funneliformis geosporum TaxID=1117311 RepID=A0A9W4T239_9GLOM|nr:412_t:CDS:10 [Funneliformis geosporum]CAI2189566.1 20019_t:CDS:10 [Funneliformis geosporum]